MEKKNARSKNSEAKVKIIEKEGGSWLIGGIVEKGVFDIPQAPSSFPQPTALPFPVARHRSHGPHWAPANSIVLNNDDGDEVEDESMMDADSMAAYANPVRRNKKKGLDVNKWREIVKSGTSSLPKKKKDGHNDVDIDNLNELRPLQNGDNSKENIQMCVEKNPSEEVLKAHTEIVEEVNRAIPDRLKMREQESSKSARVSSSRFNDSGNKPTSISLQDEINAENLARLREMSPNEIQEAQSEIMEKMNPALLEVLRRRGSNKLKKQNTPTLDSATSGAQQNLQSGNQFTDHANVSVVPENDITPMGTNGSSKDEDKGLDNGSMKKSKQATSGFWDAWSERVEAIRYLRFSLDGAVIGNDAVQTPEIGETFVHSDFTADNVAERDFLRTEGDPAAAGYTIKEAVALTRSVIPGQRALALHLLASVLDKALHNIYHSQVGHTMQNANNIGSNIDWEAIWAFALGPEPELTLCLRLSVDDNHNSVVVACLKVIQCILSCDRNEKFFEVLGKTATHEKDVYTAPVFRSKPQIDTGFLHGGLWKYNAKPSNIVRGFVDEKAEKEHTIQDDIFVSGQDVAAGLVRMGILPRMCYLLEAKPTMNLEETIISILIAMARHSPTCANAVMNCQRLVRTVVDRFTTIDGANIHSAKIKSVTLLKVLAQSDKKNCMEFIGSGIFQSMMWHLYRPTLSISHWIKSGRDHCKAESSLMVEQLRLWKVCIQYGYCVSYFDHFFPALCLWLNPPTFENLIENNVLQEFASVSMESYLVLGALARRLPNIYSQISRENEAVDFTSNETETWSWSHVSPMIDLALKWISLISRKDYLLFCATPFMWVIAAVLLMLCRVLERVTTEDTVNSNEGSRSVPWLPEFVPKIGLEIIKNGFLSHSDPNTGGNSFLEDLRNLRHQSESEASLASVCCLHGLVQVTVCLDGLIQAAKTKSHDTICQQYDFSREGRILEDGILKCSLVELRCLLTSLMNIVSSEWKYVQSIETFSRGGPAPGVGFGWGASGGGFWSETVLLAQMDARLLTQLLEIFHIVPSKDQPGTEDLTFAIQRIQSTLGVCLTLGPRDRVVMEKALDILLKVSTLKFLHFCVRHFIHTNQRFGQLQWEFQEEDYVLYSKVLSSHYRNRWLCAKRNIEAVGENSVDFSKPKKSNNKLDTIPEELDTSTMNGQDHHCPSMTVEWTHQRMPVPMHWFLSPISIVYDSSSQKDLQKGTNKLNLVIDPTVCDEIAKGGLFLLLGIEAMSSFLPTDDHSPVDGIQLIWKLHCLSAVLLNGMSVLEDERSRDVYETLQELYGKHLAEAKFIKCTELVFENGKSLVSKKKHYLDTLRFQSEIHESYSTFIETLVEQFSAVSYGDLLYGRQIAIYLHQGVETPVRLAAWKALSANHVLELLPPLDKCLGNAEGYLEPVEDDEDILASYVKSWVSGALDRAATRGSVAFTLVLHHLSYFIFEYHDTSKKLLARNKLAKSLLRDFSRNQQHQGIMLDLIRYTKPCAFSQISEQNGITSLQKKSQLERKLMIFTEVSEGNSTLLKEVEKLKSLI